MEYIKIDVAPKQGGGRRAAACGVAVLFMRLGGDFPRANLTHGDSVGLRGCKGERLASLVAHKARKRLAFALCVLHNVRRTAADNALKAVAVAAGLLRRNQRVAAIGFKAHMRVVAQPVELFALVRTMKVQYKRAVLVRVAEIERHNIRLVVAAHGKVKHLTAIENRANIFHRGDFSVSSAHGKFPF